MNFKTIQWTEELCMTEYYNTGKWVKVQIYTYLILCTPWSFFMSWKIAEPENLIESERVSEELRYVLYRKWWKTISSSALVWTRILHGTPQGDKDTWRHWLDKPSHREEIKRKKNIIKTCKVSFSNLFLTELLVNFSLLVNR